MGETIQTLVLTSCPRNKLLCDYFSAYVAAYCCYSGTKENKVENLYGQFGHIYTNISVYIREY